MSGSFEDFVPIFNIGRAHTIQKRASIGKGNFRVSIILVFKNREYQND